MDMPSENVLVLGNGFDLYHNMKTRYSDYIEFMRALKRSNEEGAAQSRTLTGLIADKSGLQDSSLQAYIRSGYPPEAVKSLWATLENNFVRYFMAYSAAVKGWIDFEILIKNITVDVEEIMNRLDVQGRLEGKLTGRETLLVNSFDKIFDVIGRGDVALKEGFANQLTGVNRREVIQTLQAEFDGLCESIWRYLKDVEPHNREMQTELTYRQIQDIRADTIVTFNYTDTYKRYGLRPDHVIHVHGSLEENNIVLGFHDDNEKELQYVYFKKYLQCIIRRTPILKQYRFSKEIKDFDRSSTGIYEEPVMHFFGHSLDITDREELQYLFDCASGIKIYFVNELDYKDKVEKVIALLGKEKALQRIYKNTIEFVRIGKTPAELRAEQEQAHRPFQQLMEGL